MGSWGTTQGNAGMTIGGMGERASKNWREDTH